MGNIRHTDTVGLDATGGFAACLIGKGHLGQKVGCRGRDSIQTATVAAVNRSPGNALSQKVDALPGTLCGVFYANQQVSAIVGVRRFKLNRKSTATVHTHKFKCAAVQYIAFGFKRAYRGVVNLHKVYINSACRHIRDIIAVGVECKAADSTSIHIRQLLGGVNNLTPRKSIEIINIGRNLCVCRCTVGNGQCFLCFCQPRHTQ